MLVLTGRK